VTDSSSPLRLKRLEVQGFKTFAARAEIVFGAGVTAIVGPNGSGKSNLADAVRWVLGEQSYSLLRARRTEDMIFAGSQQRARQGMAQATLVLDNCDGWLPLDFAEVTITRRAYRSGENEYLINGNRVRLRDLQDLLGASGLARRSYMVVGQGLVDQALSLRPEERRLLFEEAAGLTVHQAKRDEALRRLQETQANLVRVRDLLDEMGPRLRTLERQAQRAREWKQVAADLEAALRVWYGFHWQRTLRQIEQAQRAEELAAAETTRRRELLAALEEEIARLRQQQTDLRQQLGMWHRASSELHGRAEQVQRRLAVSGERDRLLGAQVEEITEELTRLQQRSDEQAQAIAEAAQRASAARARAAEAATAARAAQEAVAAAEARRRARQHAREQAQAAWARANAAVEEAQRRLIEARARREEGERAQAAQAEAVAEVEREAARLADAASVAQAAVAQAEDQALQARQMLQTARQRLDEARQREQVALTTCAEAQRRLDQLQARLDLLERLHEEGSGFFAGVRAVLQAARGGRPPLTGVVGTVGELIRAPADLERALETALGARLQDIVVERWSDAEAAISFLKRARAGRATFLPLDSLRPGRPLSAPSEPGVRGVAAGLVEADARLRDVVQLLLGRVWIVDDLAVARRILPRAEGVAQIVTVEGEVVRPGGSVTGGEEDRRGGGFLARERERRDLPRQVKAAAQALATAEADLASAREEQRQAAAALATQEQALQAATGRQAELTRRLQDRLRELDRARQTVEWRRSLAEQAARQAREVEQEIARLESELDALEAARETRTQELEVADRALADIADEDALARAGEAQAMLGALIGEQRAQEAALAQARQAWQATQEEIAQRARRRTDLLAERARLAAELAELAELAGKLQAEIDLLAGQIAPAEEAVERLAAQQATAEERAAVARQQLRQQEAAHQQAQLALARARDERDRLRREIDRDLGVIALEAGGGQADQPPLPLGDLAASLPVVMVAPEGLEQDVARLRSQLSRLGTINPDAPAEYAEAAERHAFLSAQLADLTDAIAGLHQVIAELNELMEREFKRTFDEVARRFREHFSRLFGGGSARLVLTDPDALSTTGVEIIANLPGKRSQSLALLSGGERSLTAAALIFALLEVNPPPFCILDEVDAALDEANVGRFREALLRLAARTQFILITHNRGTVEAADTLYGITMGADGVSQVLSLSLREALAAPEGA